MIQFYCPACRKGIEADEVDYGTKVHCPHCNASVQVPAMSPTVDNRIARRFWWYDRLLRLLILIGLWMVVGGLIIAREMRANGVGGGAMATVGAILFMGAQIIMAINGIRTKMEDQ